MHKLIALWSHPRSMSTATERVMRERGDLWCAHEPFMYDYYVHRQVARMPHFDVQDDHPVTYEAIRKMLLARAEQGPVFFKDMAYYVVPRILSDPEFIDRLSHVFLIRNPVASILSYYRLDAEVTLEEIGLEAQWRLFEGLRDRGAAPVVIEAEAVQADTVGLMSALWARIGLPFCQEAFEWQSEVPKDWEQVGDWHGSVSASAGIRPVDEGEAARKQKAFDACAQDAPQLKDFLAHHLPYYRKLQAQALTA